ncbi:MAG: site-2 protease family protein [Patescibacteria group bacterium]
MSIIIFLIILSVLVVVHEAGHMWVAKSVGIRVDEFGLGFPPRIKKLFSWRGTDFVLNSLPFGGYVKIFGESPSEEGEENNQESFQSKSNSKKIMVLVAGVLANFILAWILFSVIQMMGIESQDGYIKRGLFDALWHGFLTVGKITELTVVALWSLLTGLFTGQADLSQVVGPVGLVGLVGTVSKAGLAYVLYFTALISVNLGIINLFPLPALDGGRVFLVLVEWVRGKKITPKVFNAMNAISFALLIILMILITVRDVKGLL